MKLTEAVITELERNTEDSITVGIQLTRDVPKLIYKSGQHITLGAQIGGREVYRTYSICEPVFKGSSGKVRLGVRVLKNGVFSSWLSRSRVGDRLRVSAPSGIFYLRPPKKLSDNLFIASGSGITPILSMIEDLLMNYPRHRVILLYGNQTLRRTMFLERLLEIKDSYLDRLDVHFFTSRENQDVAWRYSRLDRKILGGLVDKKIIHLPSLGHIYLCGPLAMMEDCRQFFLERGVAGDDIFTEHFAPAYTEKHTQKSIPSNKKVNNDKTAEVISEVTMILQGLEQRFWFCKNDGSLLEAAHRNHLSIPHACTGGMCGTCRAKVLSGKVSMKKNYALDEEDLSKNFILTCQATPETNKLKINFDY